MCGGASIAVLLQLRHLRLEVSLWHCSLAREPVALAVSGLLCASLLLAGCGRNDVFDRPVLPHGSLQALRQASQLEGLQVTLEKPSMQDMELLTSLSGLRKLAIPHCFHEVDDPHHAAVRCIIQRAMPLVSMVKTDLLEYEESFEWGFV